MERNAFLYKNLIRDDKPSKELLKLLKNNHCIPRETRYWEFRKIFTGENVDQKIHWYKHQGDLKYLFVDLLGKKHGLLEAKYPFAVLRKYFDLGQGKQLSVHLRTFKPSKRYFELMELVAEKVTFPKNRST